MAKGSYPSSKPHARNPQQQKKPPAAVPQRQAQLPNRKRRKAGRWSRHQYRAVVKTDRSTRPNIADFLNP